MGIPNVFSRISLIGIILITHTARSDAFRVPQGRQGNGFQILARQSQANERPSDRRPRPLLVLRDLSSQRTQQESVRKPEPDNGGGDSTASIFSDKYQARYSAAYPGIHPGRLPLDHVTNSNDQSGYTDEPSGFLEGAFPGHYTTDSHGHQFGNSINPGISSGGGSSGALSDTSDLSETESSADSSNGWSNKPNNNLGEFDNGQTLPIVSSNGAACDYESDPRCVKPESAATAVSRPSVGEHIGQPGVEVDFSDNGVSGGSSDFSDGTQGQVPNVNIGNRPDTNPTGHSVNNVNDHTVGQSSDLGVRPERPAGVVSNVNPDSFSCGHQGMPPCIAIGIASGHPSGKPGGQQPGLNPDGCNNPGGSSCISMPTSAASPTYPSGNLGHFGNRPSEGHSESSAAGGSSIHGETEPSGSHEINTSASSEETANGPSNGPDMLPCGYQGGPPCIGTSDHSENLGAFPVRPRPSGPASGPYPSRPSGGLYSPSRYPGWLYPSGPQNGLYPSRPFGGLYPSSSWQYLHGQLSINGPYSGFPRPIYSGGPLGGYIDLYPGDDAGVVPNVNPGQFSYTHFHGFPCDFPGGPPCINSFGLPAEYPTGRPLGYPDVNPCGYLSSMPGRFPNWRPSRYPGVDAIVCLGRHPSVFPSGYPGNIFSDQPGGFYNLFPRASETSGSGTVGSILKRDSSSDDNSDQDKQ